MTITTNGSIALGTGLPTKEELAVYYPAKFTWNALRSFVASGDLGLLKRDKALQKRYDEWAVGARAQYGSIVNYLLKYRLRWGQPDTLSLLPSASTEPYKPLPGPENREYFSSHTPAELIFIMTNDWPYSVPPEVEHSLVWSKVPVIPMHLAHPSIVPRLEQDGIWGFTGSESPDPSLLDQYLPALADWGVTREKMIISQPPTEQEAQYLDKVQKDVQEFIRRRWKEDEWETAWFVNPPRLQSVPGLAHIHIFAKKKHGL